MLILAIVVFYTRPAFSLSTNLRYFLIIRRLTADKYKLQQRLESYWLLLYSIFRSEINRAHLRGSPRWTITDQMAYVLNNDHVKSNDANVDEAKGMHHNSSKRRPIMSAYPSRNSSDDDEDLMYHRWNTATSRNREKFTKEVCLSSKLWLAFDGYFIYYRIGICLLYNPIKNSQLSQKIHVFIIKWKSKLLLRHSILYHLYCIAGDIVSIWNVYKEHADLEQQFVNHIKCCPMWNSYTPHLAQ